MPDMKSADPTLGDVAPVVRLSRRRMRQLRSIVSGSLPWVVLGSLMTMLYPEVSWQILKNLAAKLNANASPGFVRSRHLELASSVGFLAMPAAAAFLSWWRVRRAARTAAFRDLLFAPLSRGQLLAELTRHSVLVRVVLLLSIFLLFRGETPLYYSPMTLSMWAVDAWNFGCCGNGTSLFNGKGEVTVVVVTLLWMYSALRFATAASLWTSLRGRGSVRSLMRSLLLACAPLAAGVVLYYCYRVYLLQPNFDEPKNWLGRWLAGRSSPGANFYFAMECCVIALPAVLAALLSRALWRSAAKRLDRLVTD